MTMVEIAKRNNVSERTIYRYKAYYDKMREERIMSRPFLRCYENGCMNFAVDFCTANMKQKIFAVKFFDRKIEATRCKTNTLIAAVSSCS